jgi:lysyl-tRNA synthetase class II
MAIEYKLCAAGTATELNKQVNELLQDEWALYGNPFFSPNGRSTHSAEQAGLLCQALTKVPKKVAGVR